MDFIASSHHDILICSLLLCRLPSLVFLGFWSPIPARFPSVDSGLFLLKLVLLVFTEQQMFPSRLHK